LVVVRDADSIKLAHPLVKQLIDYVRYAGTVAVVMFMYIFPDGRFVPRWSVFAVIALSVWMVLRALFPTTQINWDNWHQLVFLSVMIAWLLPGIIAMIYRYEEFSSPIQKRQTKWVVLGLGAAFTAFVIFLIPLAVMPDVTEPGTARLLYIAIGIFLFYAGMLMLPGAIAVSITRYRLWDIDFLINRSLIYGALTIGLGLMFLLTVFILQQLFHLMTGGQQSPLALAVSTLVIGGLFQPTRTALRRFVDRRLYGIHVSYRTPHPGDPLDWDYPIGEMTGKNLGAYQVEEHLGRGGMADVYKGRHVTLHRPVAIKILPAIHAKDPDFRRRFEREAHTIAKLSHPNIVQMYDFGEEENTFYMVMEYIQGPDLADLIRQRAPMPFQDAKTIIVDIAGALDYAHQQGVIHRDVKPSNIMLHTVTGGGTSLPDIASQRAVLTDFGIARIAGGTSRITGSGILGTFDYMAPEQIRDSTNIDGRVDVYALGVVAFQMLTGRLPFHANHPGAILIAHLQQPAPNPSRLRPDLSDETSDAMMRALEKDPAKRFKTAGEFAAALG
jgi:hypothetical protein